MQAFAADEGGEQQAVGPQRMTDLDEGAWKIIDELEREGAHGEVDRGGPEGEDFAVLADLRGIAESEERGVVLGIDHDLVAAGRPETASEGTVMGADDGDPWKGTLDDIEAVHQVVDHLIEEEGRRLGLRRGEGDRATARQIEPAMIEEAVVGAHGGLASPSIAIRPATSSSLVGITHVVSKRTSHSLRNGQRPKVQGAASR